MIEGLEHDDLYRMVEDEFLSTAQQFTAHLHAGEYHRLKTASKSQNADAIRDISRPVVGRMTDLVKIKQERKARREKQRLATSKAMANKGRSGDRNEGEDDWQSASLYGLMESPRKEAERLDNLTNVMTTTRAAAGFDGTKARRLFPTTPRQSVEKPSGSKSTTKANLDDATETEDDEEDEDDDLDVSSRKLPAKPIGRAPLPQPGQDQIIVKDSQALRHPEKMAHRHRHEKESKATRQANSSDDSGDDFLSRLKRRQEDRRRNREQRKQAARKFQPAKATGDTIPGFL